MVIAELNGGLGNQLFQYAAAKSLALHHNVPLWIDISAFTKTEFHELELPRAYELTNFIGTDDKVVQQKDLYETIDLKKSNSFFQLFLPKHKRLVYTEPFFHFDNRFFSTNKTVYLKGAWQSEKYFSAYKDIIRQKFQLLPERTKNVAGFANTLKNRPTVGIHVRRGDYLRMQIILEWHGVMPVEYYTEACKILQNKIGDFDAIYFTDDPAWVAENLFPVNKGIIASAEIATTHYEDFYLMSKCSHNIIANSSFSWWAAWLNNNPGKIVIGPKKWFDKGPKDTQDILPVDWIRI